MTFRAGRALNEAFHADVVRPLLGTTRYAAGLLGWGSDVLGYDTPRSTDHGWDDEPSRHQVTVVTLSGWSRQQLGIDATAAVSTTDWLLMPQQQLLGVVGGQVYAEDGRLRDLRERLAWYPDQVWRWLLACQWRRLDQEEPFVQRTAEAGDDLGSAMVAARQVRDAMRLAMLLARRYAPYSKWLGTAFARLGHPDGLDEALRAAVRTGDLAGREAALSAAYEALARRHNAAGLTEPLDSAVRRFHGRPARVLGAGRFTDACLDTVTDPLLRSLPLTGSVDQAADSTDVLADPVVARRLAGLYAEIGGKPDDDHLGSVG